MTVDSRRSQDFYTLIVQEEIKVVFEIENIVQESFVTLNQGNESVSIEQFVLTARNIYFKQTSHNSAVYFLPKDAQKRKYKYLRNHN